MLAQSNFKSNEVYFTDTFAFVEYKVDSNISVNYKPTLFEHNVEKIPSHGKLIIWIDKQKTVFDYLLNTTDLSNISIELSNPIDTKLQVYNKLSAMPNNIITPEITFGDISVFKTDYTLTDQTVVVNGVDTIIQNQVPNTTETIIHQIYLKYQFPNINQTVTGRIEFHTEIYNM